MQRALDDHPGPLEREAVASRGVAELAGRLLELGAHRRAHRTKDLRSTAQLVELGLVDLAQRLLLRLQLAQLGELDAARRVGLGFHHLNELTRQPHQDLDLVGGGERHAPSCSFKSSARM